MKQIPGFASRRIGEGFGTEGRAASAPQEGPATPENGGVDLSEKD